MDNAGPSAQVVRFGTFEGDLQCAELRKNGHKVPLQGQPFQVFAILLQHPGELVTREELRQKVWPGDTFVDFDHGLNTAITKIRTALGDEADNPRFVETVPRRGYRLIAPVVRRDAVIEAPELPLLPTPVRTLRFAGTKRLALLASCLCLLVLAVIVIRLKLRSSPPVPKVVDSVQITNDGLHEDATLQLLTDGTRLYFQEGAFVGPRSTMPPGFLQSTALVQVSTQGGETARIPVALEELLIYDFSTARSEFLVGGRGNVYKLSLWVLPLPTGPPHRVGNILALDACWSPDGNHLAFVKGKDLFVAKPDGSEVRKLVTLDLVAHWIRYSPDGTRLRFTVFTLSGHPKDWDIMEIGADGSGLRRLPIHGCCGKWSADGKYYFYQTDRDVWVLPERRTIFGGVEPGTPAQLTTGPITFGAPTPSADGKQLFVIGEQPRIELVHYESRTNNSCPFWGASPQENWRFRLTASG